MLVTLTYADSDLVTNFGLQHLQHIVRSDHLVSGQLAGGELWSQADLALVKGVTRHHVGRREVLLPRGGVLQNRLREPSREEAHRGLYSFLLV